MGGIGAGHQVRLLRARRHACRRAAALDIEDDGGYLREWANPKNSCINEMPGPEVVVKARAPFQAAPMAMPMDAISSSAWTMLKQFLPDTGSVRYRRQKRMKASPGRSKA